MNEIPFLHLRKITLQVSINVYHWWWQFLVYLPIKSNALNSGKHLSLAISFMSVTLLPLMKRKTSYFVWSFHILSTVKFRTVCVLSLKRIQLKQLMLTCRRKTSPCISANAYLWTWKILQSTLLPSLSCFTSKILSCIYTFWSLVLVYILLYCAYCHKRKYKSIPYCVTHDLFSMKGHFLLYQ